MTASRKNNLLGGLHFAQTLLLVHLVVELLAERIALNLLLRHDLLHLAGDFAFADLQVFLLLDDLHVLDFGLQLVGLRVLLLLDKLFENFAVVEELDRWFINLAQLRVDQLSALSELLRVQVFEGGEVSLRGLGQLGLMVDPTLVKVARLVLPLLDELGHL